MEDYGNRNLYRRFIRKIKEIVVDELNKSRYQDSNLGPPAPKAGALTGLRYTSIVKEYFSQMRCKGREYF